MSKQPTIAQKGVLILIRCYQKIVSPLFPNRCIYEPSCSAYGSMAIAQFGIARGIVVLILRIGRCIPYYFKGGFDPLNKTFNIRNEMQKYAYFYKKKR